MNFKTYFLIVLKISLILIQSEAITVISRFGNITGQIQVINVGSDKMNISTFLGVPYAEPPIGNLRFAKPIPKIFLHEPFLATDFHASCPQYYPGVKGPEQDEDCLYLNIFIPHVLNGSTQYPVMVYIHGGAFMMGNSHSKSYEKLSGFGEVIVVSITYRLGPFGFLTTGDSIAQGNYGLWDQHLAIKWVHENIPSFGGNPEQITIFGESAGGVSVIFQALYSGNHGLFKRAISQSGSANAAWAIVKDPASITREYAKKFKCDSSRSLNLIQCLRGVENTTAMYHESLIRFYSEGTFDWTPTVDGVFVTQGHVNALNSPTIISTAQVFNNISLMMGTNSLEGQGYVMADPDFYRILRNQSSSIENVRATVQNMLPRILKPLVYFKLTESLTEAIRFQYTNFQNPLDPNDHIRQLVDAVTDVTQFVPAYSALLNHFRSSFTAKTYQYEFNELSSLRPPDSSINGSLHGDELPFVFGSIYDKAISKNISMDRINSQWKLSKLMMTYWTNFAKTGDPNKPVIPEVIWKPFNDKERSYLYLTSAEIKNKNHLHAERVAFWLDYVPKLLKKAEVEKTKVVECSNANPGLASNVIFTFSVLLMSVCMKINFVYI